MNFFSHSIHYILMVYLQTEMDLWTDTVPDSLFPSTAPEEESPEEVHEHDHMHDHTDEPEIKKVSASCGETQIKTTERVTRSQKKRRNA